MLATMNFRHRYTVVGEISCSPVLKIAMERHCRCYDSQPLGCNIMFNKVELSQCTVVQYCSVTVYCVRVCIRCMQDYLTPLHVAAHCGNVRSAEILLQNHCTIDARALVCPSVCPSIRLSRQL